MDAFLRCPQEVVGALRRGDPRPMQAHDINDDTMASHGDPDVDEPSGCGAGASDWDDYGNCGKEFFSWKSFLEHGKCSFNDDYFASPQRFDVDKDLAGHAGCAGWSKGKRSRRAKMIECGSGGNASMPPSCIVESFSGLCLSSLIRLRSSLRPRVLSPTRTTKTVGCLRISLTSIQTAERHRKKITYF